MRVAVINYGWEGELATPEAVLARYFTLTDWSDALQHAGAASVRVYQRFRTNTSIERHGIPYEFHDDGGASMPSIWSGGAGGLHTAVAAGDPDVVHANGVLHPRRVRALRRKLPPSAALIVQDHGGFDPNAASLLKRAWLRRGLTVADALLVSSAGQADEWRRSAIAPPSLHVADVMECGTTMAPIEREDARRRSGVNGSPALLWVGRLNANKDPLTVLRGAAGFFERCPEARLTMVYASAGIEGEVRAFVVANPLLTDRVRLVGRLPRADMPAYFSAADIFVLASHREGSGYAAIEALACGALPVLTDIPSFRALTGEGRVGELWPTGDAASLTDALSRAAARVSGTARRECRDLFQQRFSWPAIGRRAMEIYNAAASRHRA